MSDIQFAFVDESGDPNLDISASGRTHYYAVCALLFDGDEVESFRSKANEIRLRYFGTGEMKSSRVGNDRKRREAILKDIVQSQICFCALVVNKKKVKRHSGLQYRESFVKHIQGRLYKHLYRSLVNLNVYAHRYGDSSFMEGFQKYLTNRNKSLFDKLNFSFVTGPEEPLIQVADMLAGSLCRIYSEGDRELRLLISPAAITIEHFPPRYDDDDVIQNLHASEQFDFLVWRQAHRLVSDYIETKKNSRNPDDQARTEALHYLLFQFENDSTQYIHAAQIAAFLNNHLPQPITDVQHVYRRIIAPLRTDGIIIASNAMGYKIPCNTQEMNSFVEWVEGQAIPYLKRLAGARNHFLTASKALSTEEKKLYDIAPETSFPELNACLRSVSNMHID